MEAKKMSETMKVSGEPSKKLVLVGVCAMEKKSHSKQMNEILNRLENFQRIKTTVFSQRTILEEPIENWPTCDCLISFHSDGFPLSKAQAYANQVKPFMINDVHMQQVLWDRRKVYSILERNGIAVPRYATDDIENIQEFDDYIIVNGQEFHKPFVEKPVSAEDHNITIYFPSSAGGGSQRLFRKTGDKSSVYSSSSKIRRKGEFIYEEFIPTDGTDVKVYSVGPNYAHAEARKSPGLDGKVYRDADGKEQRYPVILSPIEKLMARRIYFAFKQTVCGFDLLRTNGKSYVCDVNGFSFVKTLGRYYQDAAKILAQLIYRQFKIVTKQQQLMPLSLPTTSLHCKPTISDELRCVIAVVRHGDRTPKQKIKMTVSHQQFFALFQKYEGNDKNDIHLKTPNQLQQVLDIVKELLQSGDLGEDREKFEQCRFVLEMKGSFSGINRKVELKSSGNADTGAPNASLDLVVKWGGELTKEGRKQAEALGQGFRQLYPLGRSSNDTSDPQSCGLLRLHATFRHDLKIYASDEGRVQMTAAAFAKGLLALEGELPPILAHMVKSANTNGLLGHRSEIHQVQQSVKCRLFRLLNVDRALTEEEKAQINPCGSESVATAIGNIGNPHWVSSQIAQLIEKLICHIDNRKQAPHRAKLYSGETWNFLSRRWRKLLKDFCRPNNQYDLSKIPDIYDGIRYDIMHNGTTLDFEKAKDLYHHARTLANIIIPQENGLTSQEKLKIGTTICNCLLEKIDNDLERNLTDEIVYQLDPKHNIGVSTPERLVRTRLYFTSESHMHGLLQVLLYGSPWGNDPQWQQAVEKCSKIPELNYLCQIVFLLYEDTSQDANSENRFRVEVHFSPGVTEGTLSISSSSDSPHVTEHDSHPPSTYPLGALHDALSYKKMSSFLKSVIADTPDLTAS